MTQTLEGRRVEWASQILAPGEYSKLPDGTYHAGTPNGHMVNLAAHEVTEHEDGTITVSPSIRTFVPVKGAPTPGMQTDTIHGQLCEVLWHGFLERGVWREC